MSPNTEEEPQPAPTFKGRLKLDTFRFEDKERRRSPRLSETPTGPAGKSTSSATTLSVPSSRGASRSPSKRKAQSQLDDGVSNTSSPSTSSATNVASPSGRKRSRQSSSYAPPSTYAHLPLLPDAIAPNLLILFIGLNPGVQTARSGHAYAHPTNRFWRLLHSSGVTPRLCAPTEDRQMPALYSLGLTNIVARPSRNGAELSKAEMDDGVAILEEKVRRWRPEAVCVVGKSIWESVWRVRHGKAMKANEFRYGWQDESENMGVLEEEGVQKEEEKEDGVVYNPNWKGARLFVATSTSGLAATLKPQEKEEIWKQLGDWAVKRRAERAAVITEGE
ncbi:hydrolase-like protein [Dichotomopilus funicola]|uniref:Hydrolase-like protein n=1 Tax=Dichotomopilus funicola TaxID=1934379 RepID=A0AAN6VAF3_9PEZI|nr:hydrolase-like protein [Dichotomopilus funicola]